MAAIVWTKKALIQRIEKYLQNSRLRSDQFAPSANEILLMIDQSAASRMVGQVYAGAKIENSLCVPEAYYVTYALPALIRDPIIVSDWTAILPQPPMSLPLGYSVNRIYAKSRRWGQGEDAYMIKSKRLGRRLKMPLQPGVRASIQGNTLTLAASDGSSLLGTQWHIQMMSARTTDVDAVMNMPEDDVEFVFGDVIKGLAARYQIPQDIVLDGLPAGNKSS